MYIPTVSQKLSFVFFLSFVALLAHAQPPGVYNKTQTGLRYRIIPSGIREMVAKPGNWIKLHYIQMHNNDSVVGSSYGKMPVYQPVTNDSAMQYNPAELFPLLKKGDSAIVVMFVDSLISKKLAEPSQLPPFLHQGDSLILTFKVLEIFRSDSLYQVDAQIEYERDRPRQEREAQEQAATMQEEMRRQRESEWQALEQSGVAATQRKVVEDYLAAKKITAQKTGKGTYVAITRQGSGAPVTAGKYITVKFTGRILATDSTFESDSFTFQLGQTPVIEGWEEGLVLFREGGKGMLYLPGYMAYGENPPPGSPFQPGEALLFEVEVARVSDQAE